ncbi:MAG: DUF3794 domain-containing protein [Oscillospiraceae bacterium]|nr:DUF3794 domain-containing protein [Oscillospiraceae bacterium]
MNKQLTSAPSKTEAGILDTVFSSDARCRIESEAVLPDYKPDINRILSVEARPRISHKGAYEKSGIVNAEIDGVCVFNVIYSTEKEDGYYSFTFFKDFRQDFKSTLSDVNSHDFETISLVAEALPSETGGRLLGPRKIVLKTECIVSVSLKANKRIEYYSSVSLPEAETISKKASMTALEYSSEYESSITETLNLPAEYLQIRDILDCDAIVYPKEIKASDGKISVIACADIYVMYSPDSSEDKKPISFVQPIEFSFTRDILECTADDSVIVPMMCTYVKYTAEADNYGDTKVIKLEIGYKADTSIMRSMMLECVSDMYYPGKSCDTKAGHILGEKIIGSFIENAQTTIDISAPEGTTSADAVRARCVYKESTTENGKISVNAKLYTKLLVSGDNGQMSPVESEQDIKFFIGEEPKTDKTNGAMRIELIGGVTSSDCTLVSGTVKVRCDISTLAIVYEQVDEEIIDNVSSIQENAHQPEKNEMVFCYPERGETLWDIAKKYSVSQAVITEMNHFDAKLLPQVIRIN